MAPKLKGIFKKAMKNPSVMKRAPPAPPPPPKPPPKPPKLQAMVKAAAKKGGATNTTPGFSGVYGGGSPSQQMSAGFSGFYGGGSPSQQISAGFSSMGRQTSAATRQMGTQYSAYQATRTGGSFMERNAHYLSIFIVLTFYSFLPIAFGDYRWVVFMGAIALSLVDIVVGRPTLLTLIFAMMHFGVATFIYMNDWTGTYFFVPIFYSMVLFAMGKYMTPQRQVVNYNMYSA